MTRTEMIDLWQQAQARAITLPEFIMAIEESQKNLKDEIRKLQTIAPQKETAPTKLTPDQVRRIRAFKKSGLTNQQIAERFNQSVGNIVNITTRRTWVHVPDLEESDDKAEN